MKTEKSTSQLENMLKSSGAEELEHIVEKEVPYKAEDGRLFGEYVKGVIREKRITQKNIFLGAGVDEKTGYKYISGEKHTNQRDIIIRLCLGAHMNLKECERALKLYGMSPLYAKVDRDAVLIIAFNKRMYEIGEVNDILVRYGQEPLYEPHLQDGE